MGEITIHLPSDMEESIDKLVSQGVYKSREEAIIALIRAGLSAMKKRGAPRVYTPPKKPPSAPLEQPPVPPVKPPEEGHPPIPPIKPPEK